MRFWARGPSVSLVVPLGPLCGANGPDSTPFRGRRAHAKAAEAAEAAEDVSCFCEPQWCNGDSKVVFFTWQAAPAKKPRECTIESGGKKRGHLQANRTNKTNKQAEETKTQANTKSRGRPDVSQHPLTK